MRLRAILAALAAAVPLFLLTVPAQAAGHAPRFAGPYTIQETNWIDWIDSPCKNNGCMVDEKNTVGRLWEVWDSGQSYQGIEEYTLRPSANENVCAAGIGSRDVELAACTGVNGVLWQFIPNLSGNFKIANVHLTKLANDGVLRVLAGIGGNGDGMEVQKNGAAGFYELMTKGP